MNRAERGGLLTGLAALIAAVIATRPYTGIRHDAELYMAQALRSAGAAALDRDLTFEFGNQQNFSLFDLGYAPLVSALGPSGAHQLGWALGLTVWVLALIVLLRALGHSRGVLLMVAVGVLLMNPAYGPGVLHYAESFVTPRIFGGAVAMLSLAYVMRGRRAAGVGTWLVSAALHPLMALPAGLVGLRLAISSSRVFWLVLFGGAALAVILALLGVPPFHWLMQRIDSTWMQVVRYPHHVTFPDTWPAKELLNTAVPLVALGVAAYRCDDLLARVARACLLVAALGFGLSLLGASVWDNRLIVALQTWRALWLLALFGNIAAVTMAVQGPNALVWRAVVLVSATEHIVGITPVASSLLALAAALSMIPGRAGRWLAAAPMALVTLVIVTLPFSIRPNPDVWLYVMLAGAALVLMLAPPRAVWARVVVSVGVVLASVAISDARSEWRKWSDAPVLPDHIASAVRGLNVYWEGGRGPMWFGPHVPQYFSCRQKAGAVFYRDQAIEFARRADGLRPLGTGDFRFTGLPGCPDMPEGGGRRDPATLRGVCETLPELDLIVLLDDASYAQGETWMLPVDFGRFEKGLWTGRGTGDATTWRVHDCRELRGG